MMIECLKIGFYSACVLFGIIFTIQAVSWPVEGLRFWSYMKKFWIKFFALGWFISYFSWALINLVLTVVNLRID